MIILLLTIKIVISVQEQLAFHQSTESLSFDSPIQSSVPMAPTKELQTVQRKTWKCVLFPYSHSVLFTELAHSQLVQGGGHVLGRLLQVLRITLHQGPRDAATSVLSGGRERSSLKGSGRGISCLTSKHPLNTLMCSNE